MAPMWRPASRRCLDQQVGKERVRVTDRVDENMRLAERHDAVADVTPRSQASAGPLRPWLTQR
jgi:hypothetical protein